MLPRFATSPEWIIVMDNLRTRAIQLVFSMNDAKDAEVERGAEFVHEITKEEAKDLQLSQTFEELPPQKRREAGVLEDFGAQGCSS